ncbi:GNAT family N-acetyltransferase [Devosia sp. XJ19-1]|uniref:GNAT family N-acetyltransferase n=1 Tax=Devosia ureilytica TaxID=2952754 RepID=A0A9Q4AN76_9HYPH|nr:GNAT family N-acetyltransferase [Devosia ureilytica]MCP8886775.1 GNAT family N-acetyltransferase [Devosia ureilytica]
MSFLIREAQREDASAMSAVLIASITELCHADHGDDREKIADWTANKTPAGILDMLAREGFFMAVAELDGQIVAVGATTAAGEIALNYVAPSARFRGVSKALLAHMEADLASRGFAEGKLRATTTAKTFYFAQGWSADTLPDGAAACFAMHKRLGR